MAILKCKMCGGNLPLVEDSSIATCEYCGVTQTVPKVDGEKKLTQFGRAERLRKQCEFDKAAGIYESIVADFPEEAEAYWGLVLCKYGIEYVDDPATGKKIPTCHRSSFDSVMEDSDFEQALENADATARKVYRDEAKTIEQLRKGIVSVSAKEEPYDIFICYKETDESGDRTLDSVLAQDLYDVLVNKGYRVFFARISLEDKLGLEYEPYIFAALNSAKIMLAVGTDYEYYNAVWVKNEWSRFLKLMTQDKDKHLIPCYKGIDAYDMPREFAKLQAQDLGKVGATQDLLRGIEKLLPRQAAEPVKETVVVQQPAVPAAAFEPLLRRAFMFLEDKDWRSADEYCEKVLDMNPECAEAYLGKLLAELHVTKVARLAEQAVPFDDKSNYQKAIRFADESLRTTLERYLAPILDRERQERFAREKKEEEERLAWEKKEEEERFTQETLLKRLSEVRERNSITRDILAMSCDHIVALKVDGTVLATGNNEDGQCEVWHWRNVVAVGAGTSFTVGLKSDGTMVVAGKPYNLDLSPVRGWQNIVAISAEYDRVVGLQSDGSVLAVGSNEHGQNNVEHWRDIVSIQTGPDFTMGVKADGSVVVAGEEKMCAQLWAAKHQKDTVAIECVDFDEIHVLKADGTVKSINRHTEKNEYPDVQQWRNIVALDFHVFPFTGLTSAGTVVVSGENSRRKSALMQWSDVVAIRAQYEYTIGLKSDGTLLADGLGMRWKKEIQTWKLFDSLDTLKQEQTAARQMQMEQAHRRQAGVCPYCGNEFKGVLFKTCTFCGRPKDY